MASTYEGPVVFVAGVHYPAEIGGANLERPLRWVEGSTYRPAEADEPTHNDTHHGASATLEPGTE